MGVLVAEITVTGNTVSDGGSVAITVIQGTNNVSNDIITFGNGNGDFVYASSSSNDRITFGNGQGDSVALGSGAGGDTIITGTGAGDTVYVGAHTNADTFGFSLGTNGSSYTTVTGAQAGDHVIAGIYLGNNVSNNATAAASLAAYISDLGTVHSGDTYVGYNGTDDTFIVTDSASHIGAIEIVGSFTGTVANHVLTLHEIV